MKERTERRFKFRPRTLEQVRKRAEQSGGVYDRWYDEEFEKFAASVGEHDIRPLPPTWDDAEHYGFDVYVHYGVGPDNQQYLCLDKMKGEKCPVCEAGAPVKEAAAEAERRDDKAKAKLLMDQARQFRATKRIVMWIIDRKEQSKGPLLYDMPWTLDKKFADRAIDRRTGEVMMVDDPEKGYDLSFKREGTGLGTEYSRESIARNSSPLSDRAGRMDKWLKFVQDHPIPDVLRYFDYEHIAKAFAAAGEDHDDEDDEDKDDDKKSSRRGKDRDDDERPSRKARDEDDDEGEDDRPSKKRDRDEDDDEDDDEPPSKRKDEDDDEEPPRKKKGKEIDDDDESLDDDPDDDERPSKRKRRDDDEPEKPKRKRLEEDEDDDEPPRKSKRDDDEDDEPPKKKRTRDDDEPEEPPRKSSKSKRDEDDDDEGIPF